jgi:phage-related protein
LNFYRTEDGDCPVREFLDRLDGKDVQKALWVFRLIERIDRVPKQYLKKLVGSDDIWECRVRTANGAYRFFSFFVHGGDLVVTHGYAKKTNRVDPREIRRATRYRLDYLARMKGASS